MYSFKRFGDTGRKQNEKNKQAVRHRFDPSIRNENTKVNKKKETFFCLQSNKKQNQDLPGFQTDYTGIQECEVHVQRMWSAVPQAECSFSVLSLRTTQH